MPRRQLGLVLEARVGNGKLLMTSIDVRDDLDQRPAARRLRRSLLDCAAGPAFQPAVALSVEQVRSLLQEPPMAARFVAHRDVGTSATPRIIPPFLSAFGNFRRFTCRTSPSADVHFFRAR